MDSDTNYKETELRLGPPGASSPVRETKNLLVVETKKCSEDSSSSSATSELALLSPRRSSAEKKFFPDDDEKSPQQQQQQQQQSQNNQQQQQQQKTNQNQFWNTAAPAVQIQGLAGAKRGFSQAMEGRKVWGFSPDKLSVDTGAASKNGSTVVLPPMVAGSPKAGPPVWPAEHAFMNGSSAPVPRSGSAAAVNLSNNGSRQLLNDAPGSSSREPVAAKVSVPEMPVAPKAPEERPSAPKVQAVGWPPIRNFRRNSLAPKQADDKESKLGNGALYVKVSMDGAPYLRKVDLKMYKKYQELSSALERMFTCFTIGQYGSHGTTGRDGLSESKLMDLLSGSEYVLTYEDKDSDWMLVGDVPWEMFVDSCRRLRIMKSSEAIGLAPRAMEKSKNRC